MYNKLGERIQNSAARLVCQQQQQQQQQQQNLYLDTMW